MERSIDRVLGFSGSRVLGFVGFVGFVGLARRSALRVGGFLWVLGFLVVPVSAHEIPATAFVQMLVRPEGERLIVLMRLPLVSLRDFNWPMRDETMVDLERLEASGMVREAVRQWVVPALAILEDDRLVGPLEVMATRVRLPADRAFASYDEAAAALRGPPLASDALVPVTEALVDVRLEAPIRSASGRFAIEPALARFGLRVVTTLRFMLPGQPERALQFVGDPGLVHLDPRWHQAALRFVWLGFEHILDGIDHLLFIVCLVLPVRRFWPLVGVVTSFTVAHSITLAASAFGHAPDALWFPPLVETLIAASIVYMALENMVWFMRARAAGPRGWAAGSVGVGAAGPGAGAIGSDPARPGFGRSTLKRRWLIAFAFGLVHGFGFSFALQETLQFAGDHLVLSLASFNVGVELGQVLVLLVLVPLLALLYRFVVEEWIGGILISLVVGHTAWHWMIERGATLREYDWSLSDPATLASVLRWLMVVVAVWFAVWALGVWRRRRRVTPP